MLSRFAFIIYFMQRLRDSYDIYCVRGLSTTTSFTGVQRCAVGMCVVYIAITCNAMTFFSNDSVHYDAIIMVHIYIYFFWYYVCIRFVNSMRISK